MFKIKANPTFEALVKIPTPDGEQTLTLVFKHKTRSQVMEYFGRASKEEVQPEGATIAEIVADWKGVDVPFSPEAIADLVENYHAALSAIFDAYIAALTQAKQGN